MLNNWEKKEKPIQGMMGMGGGATGYLVGGVAGCLLYTSPSPRDATLSRMPSSA